MISLKVRRFPIALALVLATPFTLSSLHAQTKAATTNGSGGGSGVVGTDPCPKGYVCSTGSTATPATSTTTTSTSSSSTAAMAQALLSMLGLS